MTVKSNQDGQWEEITGVITSCQLESKKREERADAGNRFRRLEAPVRFSFVTENVGAISHMLESKDWCITEIRVSGVLIDARALAKLEQIPLPRLAARVGIGRNQPSHDDLKDMGTTEQGIFGKELGPPRALTLCEKNAGMDK